MITMIGNNPSDGKTPGENAPAGNALDSKTLDSKAMDSELELAKAARREAEEALLDVDEMIWELQHFQPGRQRIVFSIAGFEQEAA